ncbi:histidine phosphatase family protein [Agromyces atrinae]|uniref:Histidine phosphatase family protein n=1 Tax=Agromyces atrinae TaxID=592376 RepID=A0A4V1R2G0_9MICO|nr:histidine phosphatase family protein [Agromyces atrinae]NYD67131.1 putative phosphoglycerate mutase [Agromyces atrinae]RXZ87026.1 histidine phosphatase family protein [Agromyces atrinae]
MVLALIRHGQTDWNLAEKMQGSSDIPLNDTGRAQALVAAAVLAEGDWSAVVSSPLQRARETAAIIAGELSLELGPTYDDLREQNFGSAEGLPITEVDERWPGRSIPDKEPDSVVGERGLRALEEIVDAYGDTDVVVVAHGTLLRCIFATIDGRDQHDYPRLDNASSSLVGRGPDGWRVLTIGGVPTIASEQRLL